MSLVLTIAVDNNFVDFYAELNTAYNLRSMNHIAIHVFGDPGDQVYFQVSNDGIGYITKQQINNGEIIGSFTYSYIKFISSSGNPNIKVCCNRIYSI